MGGEIAMEWQNAKQKADKLEKDNPKDIAAELAKIQPPKIKYEFENEGQYPSMELFIQLITMFDISVDQYIFPDKKSDKCTLRRQIDTLLDTLDNKELSVVEATMKGLCNAKE